MASTTQQKYDRLNVTPTASNTDAQLMYPTDYASDMETPGHVMVFEFSRIQGDNIAQIKGTSTKGSTANQRVAGEYGQEVAFQQKAMAANSMRAKTGMTNNLYKKTDQSIVLPIPPQLSFNDGAQWQNVDFSALASVIDFGKSVGDAKSFEEMKKAMGPAATKGAAKFVDNLGKAAGADLGLSNLFTLGTGLVSNPYSEVLFSSMSNRTFNLSWTLAPRNQTEAKVIQGIVHRFRFHQRPEIKFGASTQQNTSFLISPSVVDVSFIDLDTGSHIPTLPKFSTCAITNIEVDNTPNGNYSINVGGNQTAIRLTISFMELSMFSKNQMTDVDNSF